MKPRNKKQNPADKKYLVILTASVSESAKVCVWADSDAGAEETALTYINDVRFKRDDGSFCDVYCSDVEEQP